MGTKLHDPNSRVEMVVKLDYSATYRENEKLDLDLDDQIISLTRSAQRLNTAKEDKLETAKADADKILKLKEAVNNNSSSKRGEEDDGMAIVCRSSPKLKRSISTLSSSSGRSSRPGSCSASSRRTSVLNAGVNQHFPDNADGAENVDRNHTLIYNNSGLLDQTRRMSITERRRAFEREQFSSKNLFNVIRRSSTFGGHSSLDGYHSNSADGRFQDESRKSVTASAVNERQQAAAGPGMRLVRPRTSPALSSSYRRTSGGTLAPPPPRPPGWFASRTSLTETATAGCMAAGPVPEDPARAASCRSCTIWTCSRRRRTRWCRLLRGISSSSRAG